MFDFNGKNIVYVGGFGGMGYQFCRMMMKKPIKHLVICSRMENVEMLKKLQTECDTVRVHFVQMNLMDRVSIDHAIKQVVGVITHIDVLINGAGVLADKDVETTIGVNLTGLIYTTMAFMPYMDQSQMGHGGMVMNIASVFGLEPAPTFAVYAAAKHGVVGFTRSMADEHYYRKTGVSFICVCPGMTSTELMVNMRSNVTMEQHSKEMMEVMSKAKQQTPEECAMSMMKVMELMKNGSIYMCDMGQMKEVTPTVYWHM